MAKKHSFKIKLQLRSGTRCAWSVLFILIIVGISCPPVFSQEYFQQEVNYTITVSLNDTLHQLDAFEKMKYINHSPHTLNYIWFHLWPNAYSNNQTPLAKQILRLNGKSKLFDDPELSGFIDSLDFKVNNRRVSWSFISGQPDICRIELNEALKTGDTLLITTPFRVKIPKGVTSRIGHIGESYQISQWYPKPAVFDQDGWHPMSYLDQGEFYAEFGSFDISITLPDNYTVGATGMLQNQQEYDRLEKLAADTSWIKASHLGRVPFPTSSKILKTLQYRAIGVHDFAWFADKRFNVMKGKIKLPNSGKEVTTWVMFTNRQSNLWKHALDYVNDAILWASQKIGDYPYSHFTAVQSALSAGYGMEYPGITVIGIAEDAYALDEVLSHEIIHNWFYGTLASNERKYPFMDEGITSTYTARYMKEKYPLKKLWQVNIKDWKLARFFNIDHLPAERMQELEWLVQARNNLEQPIDLPATEFSDKNYGIILYNKATIAFNYLRASLGDAVFDAAMRDYYQQWMFKHPRPKDLRNSFENHTNKDLTWFFDELLGTSKRLDYKMLRLKKNRLLVKNNAELISPLHISGMTGDSIFFDKWVDGFAGKQWIELPEGDYTSVKIDPGHLTPEIFRINNNIQKTNLFQKADPIKTQLLLTVDDPEKHNLMILPAINWNRENGFMAGIALHNGFIIPKPFEYFIMPFYAFGNKDLAGIGRLTYNIIPYDKWIRRAALSLEGARFGAPGKQNFQKLKTGLDLYFSKTDMTSPISQKIYGNFIRSSDLHQIEKLEKAAMNSTIQVGYQLEKKSFINPFKITAAFESGKSYQKTSVEFQYTLSYFGEEKGLDVRLFTGMMLKEDSKIPFYSLSAAGRSGHELYLFQGTYPDRFAVFPSNLGSRQMSPSEGALVSPVNDSLGYSNWLVSLSLTSSLPEKVSWLPLKPFMNIVLNENTLVNGHNSPIFFEAGLKSGVWNLLEIYVPLLVTDNVRSASGPFKNRIRFVFSLDSFNKKRLFTK